MIGPVDRVIKALVLSAFVSQKMASFTVKPNREDLQLLKQFIEEGTLTPVIDRTYPLAQVPEAIGIWKRDTLKEKSSSPCEANSHRYDGVRGVPAHLYLLPSVNHYHDSR